MRIVTFSATEKEDRPANSAVQKKDGSWIVYDDQEDLKPGAVVSVDNFASTPEKKDLPKDHPLYGKRLLEPVLSGEYDIEVKSDGSLVRWKNGKQYNYETDGEIEEPIPVIPVIPVIIPR